LKGYDEYYHKDTNSSEYIWLQAEFNISEIQLHEDKLCEILKIEAQDTSLVKLFSVVNITWKNETKASNFYSVTIYNDFPFYKYIYDKETGITLLKVANELLEEVTVDNYKKLLKSGQKTLTKKEFEAAIALKLKKIATFTIPKINFWKPSKEYLINEIIDLEKFKIDTEISIPLKNIFNISGYKNDLEISKIIDKAISKPEFKAELQSNLSQSITTYINKIWKEHKINIKINIDGSNCSVHVEDKDREFKYYSMKQRSDGFNQFISLILSLSTSNENEELKNNIILLDEPEIHLHPSGVRYMRDEILKIGKNNFVLVSTHSHYMVDTNTPERHFIISKNKMKTSINQVSESATMNDDQVLANAFGLSLFKELLPQNIIIVEGGDDKVIFSHVLSKVYPSFFYSIKSAGGASKVYSLASILLSEELSSFFILDDDKDGRDAKKDILLNLKGGYSINNVFTIKDLLNNLPEKSTIEDLLPKNFIKKFFEEEMKHEFLLDKDLPIIFQIKNEDNKLKENKEQLNALKIKLSEKFIIDYDTKAKLEKNTPVLVALMKALIDKMQK
jgi:predicted ATP-dependent endonuclease of OLD family